MLLAGAVLLLAGALARRRGAGLLQARAAAEALVALHRWPVRGRGLALAVRLGLHRLHRV